MYRFDDKRYAAMSFVDFYGLNPGLPREVKSSNRTDSARARVEKHNDAIFDDIITGRLMTEDGATLYPPGSRHVVDKLARQEVSSDRALCVNSPSQTRKALTLSPSGDFFV